MLCAHAAEASQLRAVLSGGCPTHSPFIPCREGNFAASPQLTSRFTASTPVPIEGEVCRELVFCCLTSASRRSAMQGDGSGPSQPAGQLRSTLETAEDATYSSLRRKKSHSLPGDMLLRPEHEWTTLASGAISKQRALPISWNLARPESKHDFVTCAARGRIKVKREKG